MTCLAVAVIKQMLRFVMRPWREIARELTKETDQRKLIQLSEELNRAIAEQGLSSKPADSVSDTTKGGKTPCGN
jgi:hypothetical protein